MQYAFITVVVFLLSTACTLASSDSSASGDDEIIVTMLSPHAYRWHSLSFTASAPPPYKKLKVDIMTGGSFDEELQQYRNVESFIVRLGDEERLVELPQDALIPITYPDLGSMFLTITNPKYERVDWFIGLEFKYGEVKPAAECANLDGSVVERPDDDYVMDVFKVIISADDELEWRHTDGCAAN